MAGRRLFCFAMQSRRRRKKVGDRPLRAGDRGVARTLGQITPSKDAMGRHDREDAQGDMAAPSEFRQECYDGTGLVRTLTTGAKVVTIKKVVAVLSLPCRWLRWHRRDRRRLGEDLENDRHYRQGRE
jgi:hypothetical protein